MWSVSNRFLSYLAGSKSVSARPPADPDTMTNTTLEATASSSGNEASNFGCLGFHWNSDQTVADRVNMYCEGHWEVMGYLLAGISPCLIQLCSSFEHTMLRQITVCELSR